MQEELIYQHILQLDPLDVEALLGLGNLYFAQDKVDLAQTYFQQAVNANPNSAEALFYLANCLRDKYQFEQAEELYFKALSFRPDLAEASNNIGFIKMSQGKPIAAIDFYKEALVHAPLSPTIHTNLGFAYLMLGNYRLGWQEYEWRLRGENTEPRNYPKPKWEGQSLADKRIFLYTDQGFGDTIQFIRYASLVKQKGATVLVECQSPLLRLLSSVHGIDSLLVKGEKAPEFDYHLPLSSLPYVFQTALETIPRQIPYLSASISHTEIFSPLLDNSRKLRIGISWQGNTRNIRDKIRSIPLKHLLPIIENFPNVEWLSLQKDAGIEQLHRLAPSHAIKDMSPHINDFADTAAILKHLDLLLTIESAVCHLGGALGIPTWVLLDFTADWRWMLERKDSPWYPSIRLFRQKSFNHWPSALASLQDELTNFVMEKENHDSNRRQNYNRQTTQP